MSQGIFNLSIIIIAVIAIAVFIFLLPTEYNKCFAKGQTTVRIVCFIVATFLAILMIGALDFTGTECVSGQVKEITHIGSFGGFYDRYRIRIIDSSGNLHEFQSVLPVYALKSEHIDDFLTGEIVKIYGSTIIDSFFYRIEAADNK